MTKHLIYLANLIILCSTPFITPYLIPGYSLVITILLCAILMLESRMGIKYSNDLWTKYLKICIGCAIVQGFLTFVFFIDEFGSIGLRNAVGMSMRYVFVLLSIPLIKHHYNKFHSVLWIINIIIIILAIILFFLCFFGIYLPYIEFSPDGRPHFFFYIGATNHMYEFGEWVFIRTAGFCDEPGRLALVLIYLLVLNEFTYKNSYIRLFLCFAGFLTFSAAFFITLVPLIVYWKIHKIINLRALSISVLFGIVVAFIYLQTIETEIRENIGDAFDILVTNRFQIGNDGKFQGDNRSEAIELQFEAFAHSPILGILGKGPEYEIKCLIWTPTFVSGMARYGLFNLGFYLPFILLFMKYWKTSKKWLFIAIGLNFLQRPELEHMFFLIVLSLIYYNQYYIRTKSVEPDPELVPNKAYLI